MATTLRVRPRVWIGLAIYIGYVIVFLVQRLTRIPHTALEDSGRDFFLRADERTAQPISVR